MPTTAPRSARASANPAPMPDDPPVTSVRHPCRSNAIVHPTFVSVRARPHLRHSGHWARVDTLLTRDPARSHRVHERARTMGVMADFLAVLGIVGFVAVMLGLIWALDRV